MRVAALLTVAALAPFAGVSGQDSGTPAEPEVGAWEEILRLYEQAREAGEQVPKDVYEWLKQDLQSIGDWEYRVFDTEPSDAATTEARLNELGAERWECIWVQPVGHKTRFILKRPARSYLREIPLSQLMKLIPQGDSGDSGP